MKQTQIDNLSVMERVAAPTPKYGAKQGYTRMMLHMNS